MILVTGHKGYIGPVMLKVLTEAGHPVSGLDCDYYKGCDFYQETPFLVRDLRKDIRSVSEADLDGVTAVIHLAALSNDPLGELNPSLTAAINFHATVRLAELARKRGVQKFIFSSSCSVYGIAPGGRAVAEKDPVNPLTAYAKAKIGVEGAIAKLANDRFHPVFMRNATVYGVSPRLRLDLVVNNLTAAAFLTSKISILSDGSPWRPLVHVEDFCGAFLAALEAPAEKIHNETFNVGINSENYQVKDIAAEVGKIIPHCQVLIMNQTGPDERSYRVDFSKIHSVLPDFKPRWNVPKGISQLYDFFQREKVTETDFTGNRYFRVRHLRSLIESKSLDSDLRFASLQPGHRSQLVF